MARFLLDSTTIILVSRGQRAETEWLARSIEEGHELGVTAVILGEAYSGAHLAEREPLSAMLAPFAVWPTEPDDGRQAGIMRYDLARHGFQVHLPDALIAAVAARLGATVVTRNVKDFARLDVPLLDPSAR